MITENNQIVEVINTLCDKFGIAVDWASENLLPQLEDLAARYIKYKITIYSILTFLCLSAFCFCFYWLIKMIKMRFIDKDKKENTFIEYCPYPLSYYQFSETGFTVFLASLMGAILLLIALTFLVASIVKCAYLPEIVIYNYLKTLV